MGRRREKRLPSDRAIEARERAKTKRSKIRWGTAQVIVAAALAAASPVAAAMLERGSAGVSVLTVVLVVVVIVGVPMAVTKMVFDARKIQLLEARIRELELHNVRLQVVLEKPREAGSPHPDRRD